MLKTLYIPAFFLFIGCAALAKMNIKEIGPNKYETTCQGEDNSQYQQTVWEKSDGPFREIFDEREGRHWDEDAKLSSKQFKYTFSCTAE